MGSDINYYRRRADEERAAAMQAVHPQARRSHQGMAERYEDLANGICQGE